MAENYKITKQIGFRILELRNEGLTFPKISAQIKNEFEVEIVRSSIERFYKNFLKGSSRILPRDVMNIQIKHTYSPQTQSSSKQEPKAIENPVEDFSGNPLLNLPRKSTLNTAQRPSDELLSLFNSKGHTK